MRRFYTLLLSLITPLYIFCQDFSYTRYDSKNGLAGSTVYCITQDKDGFLWFGTETGLSRFDGTHFRNYTLEDGLPDNEIIQLFGDSKGRVWISPFRKTVVYHYKGKIYNNETDTSLKKLLIHDHVVRFAEDNDGNVLLQEPTRLHLIKANGEVQTIRTNGNKPLGYLSQVAKRKEGGFWVVMDNTIQILHDNRFSLWKTLVYEEKHFANSSFIGETFMYRTTRTQLAVLDLKEDRIFTYPYSYEINHINFCVVDNKNVAGCNRNGAYIFNIDEKGNTPSAQHLRGISVSNVYKDREGNWWFLTFGNGAYRLNSAEVRNIRFEPGTIQDYQVESLLPYRGSMLAATTMMDLYKLSIETGKLEKRFQYQWPVVTPTLIKSTLGDDRVIVGTRDFLARLSDDLSTYSDYLGLITTKAMCAYGKTLLIATERMVVQVDQKTFQKLDTIWGERATCIYPDGDTIYLGTLNGLYRLNPGKKSFYLGNEVRAWRGRIAAITKDENNVLWVATAGDGLIAWKNGKLLKHFTHKDGLTSNICRRLFYENGNLWVGTDKGLNKIHVLQPGYAIEKYTTSDGLLSDIVNAVSVVGKKVFVGTPEGVTFFDEEKIANQSRCDLRFIDITIAGTTYYPSDAPVYIPHNKNSIEFNFVGISFKANGDIRYRYRLVGLDSVWHETRETYLSYPTLPSGDYALQLQAINKFDVHSNILVARFTVEKLLYEKTWFRIATLLLFLAITALVVLLIIRRIRRREQEKTQINKRISELEQLSRKAQMNPHFIFNSLNSIQQYVMDADVTGANKFISAFSRLIRQTLDFSSRPDISLDEELGYLTNYLELEKTRLENAFSFAVHIDKDVEPTEYHIPPMILQPFVENSVRHGLRFRRDKNGVVTITINRQGDHLVIILEDNGVGRKAAMQYKSISPINYQSKGLSLTADRIEMFNKEHILKIYMKIDDLVDDTGNALGTRVTINFPVI